VHCFGINVMHQVEYCGIEYRFTCVYVDIMWCDGRLRWNVGSSLSPEPAF
jgi:hypothetical protein